MQSWVSPPAANGACVAGMATVVETYAPPDASRVPVVCRDEQPVQGLQDTRGPIAAPQHQARRVDDDYARTGTASVCMVVEPLQGWRPVRVRAQRTTVDGALEMEALRRTRDAEARQVRVVCANFNTQTMGALYAAFAAERARKLVRRLALRYTPQHGSGLNSAEHALSALTRQG